MFDRVCSSLADLCGLERCATQEKNTFSGSVACVLMSPSSFLRLGGMIVAYKIVPDEIDEIKVKIVHTVF